MSKWVMGRVVSQKEWAPGLYSLFVKANISDFVAGQFAQISLDSENQKMFRPYSFASSPTEPLLEFYYDIINGGQLTAQLSALAPEDPIWIGHTPHGRFILSDIPSADNIWLLATGTGLGVFLAMLKSPEIWSRFRQIVLVHSVRYQNALSHQAIIQSWVKQFPQRFHFFPVVTREPILGAFSERLPILLKEGRLDNQGIPLSLGTSQVMLCGNPLMVKQMSDLLKERGMAINRPRCPGHVTVESYWKE